MKKNSKKKRNMRGRDFLPMHIGNKRSVKNRTLGNNSKMILLADNVANVIEKGKSKKVKILSVLKNTADPQFVRRNIVTKGALIQTELGEARVTSRPGQAGTVNAVLVKKK